MADHELRNTLNDEIHGRATGPVSGPARIIHLAFTITPDDTDPLSVLAALATSADQPLPPQGSLHYRLELGGTSVRFERHGEFYRVSIRTSQIGRNGYPKFDIPADWTDTLPGKRLVAIKTQVFPKSTRDIESRLNKTFGHDDVAGSAVGQGTALVWTDFRIKDDGFTHFIVLDQGMVSLRLGRMIRRLHEIEIYRMMSLLALPLARRLQPEISKLEQALTSTIERMHADGSTKSDQALLQELTSVSREVERMHGQSSYRFSATRTYSSLVRKRIEELGEARIENHQRLGALLERRYGPAMSTCRAMAERIEALSLRCERAGNLLRTRVDIALESQNQELLASMNARARQQLRLQETVEGLSIVAISYYAFSLVSKAIAIGHGLLPQLNVDVSELIGLPAVIAAVWLFLRNSKRRLS